MNLTDSVTGKTIRVWGRNGAVSTSLEDLYQYDQPIDWYTILTASGTALDVTSSSAQDVLTSGTGAWTIKIVGLGPLGVYQEESVNMNGQTIVTTTKLFTDVWGADVTASGTGLNNAGDIHIVKSGTGGVYTAGVPGTITSGMVKILTGWSTSMNGHFKVPTSDGPYLVTDLCFSSYTQSAAMQVVLREFGATDKSSHVACVFGCGSNGFVQVDMRKAGIVLSAGQSIHLRPIAATSGAVVQGTLILEKVQ